MLTARSDQRRTVVSLTCVSRLSDIMLLSILDESRGQDFVMAENSRGVATMYRLQLNRGSTPNEGISERFRQVDDQNYPLLIWPNIE